MNVLVIAPHPDDEVIGCGGAICLHVARGDRVAVVFLTSGELGLKRLPPEKARATREREARAAGRILGVADMVFLRLPDWFVGEQGRNGAARLAPILKQERPELIYLPHPADGHPDHRATLPLVRHALARASLDLTPTLRCYEVWTPLSTCEHHQNISKVMSRKLRALRAHRSQLESFDYVAAVKGLNQFRGALGIKCRYAEAFEDAPARRSHRAN